MCMDGAAEAGGGELDDAGFEVLDERGGSALYTAMHLHSEERS